MRLNVRAAVLALAASGCVLSQVQAADGVLSDRRLPRDTFVYFSIPSVEEAKARFAASHGSKLWSDPLLDDFKAEIHEAFGEHLNAVSGQLQQAIGLTPEDLLSIPTGEVTFAIASAGRRPAAVMFLGFGDSRDAVESLLEKADGAIRSEGVEKTSEEYEDTEISVYTTPNPGNNPIGGTLGYFIRDDQFVVATDLDLLKSILGNWEGNDDDSFVSNESWAYVHERCRTNNDQPVLSWYVDPIGMVQQVAQALPQASMAVAFLPTLGLDKLKAMGGIVDVAVGKYDTVSRSVIVCDEPAGVLRVFMLKEGDMTPPDWVTSSVSVYSAMHWRVDEAYNAIEGLVDSFSGQGAMAERIDQIAQQGPQIHLKNDIIDQMTGLIQIVGAAGGEGAGGPEDIANLLNGKMVFALGCKDEAQMNSILGKLSDLPGFPGEVREFRDATIIEVPNPQTGQAIGLSVARGSLMFGTDVTLLEQIIRGDSDGTPLAESDAYQRLASEFPSQTSAISYTNSSDQIRALYTTLRSGDLAGMLPGVSDLLEQIDFKTLPPFEKLEKYLLPSGGYTVSDEQGAFSESFSLAP